MRDPTPPRPPADSLALDLRIDDACRRFEAEWKGGRVPRVDDFLVGWAGGDADALRAELRLLDAHYARAAEPTPPARPEGERWLGEFRVGRELGRGGMGVVYEAHQRSLNRPVALKVLAGAGLTPAAVRRFRREAEAAARLHHTNIVPIYATGEQDGTHFYAMELIDGPSLDRVLRDLRAAGGPAASPTALDATAPYRPDDDGGSASGTSGLSGSSLHSSGGAYFDTVARMVAEVADALDHAHKAGVVHRDVKPSNLLVSPAGRLCVNDFGLARVLEQPGMTITGEMLGTPRYMSPEQITAGRIPVDHRCDVYSLGATLYELLTLEPPFRGETRDQLLAQIIQKEPRRPRAVNPKVPVDLETICLKAMEKDPDRRYQTAGAMADDLRRYVARFAILARRVGPLGRVKRWARRNPALAAAVAGAVGLGLAAGGLAYRNHMNELARQEDVKRLEAEQKKQEEEHKAELLEQQKRAAMEKAVLACRLENTAEAKAAILEAKQLGCSPGQIDLLEGQLELCVGNVDRAVGQLEEAAKLLPDSVAAWAMLAVAFNKSGKNGDSVRALAEATRLTATTAEDFLFRAYAESFLDPDRAMATMDVAVSMRSTPLTQLCRCEVARYHLMMFPDVERAKQAMDDIRALKRLIPANAFLHSISVSVHLSCLRTFEEFRLPDLRQAAFEEGMKDVRAIERLPDSGSAGIARWLFLDGTRQAEAGIESFRAFILRTNAIDSREYAGAYFVRIGKSDETRKLLAPCAGITGLDFYQVLALADLGERPAANKLLDQIRSRKLSDWDLFNSQLLLRFLDRKEEAVAAARAFLGEPAKFPPVRQEPFRHALRYCAGQTSADELVRLMNGHRGDLCNAHLCVGLTALADGDRTLATAHFDLCVKTGVYEFWPYQMALIMLARMNADQHWPGWIAAKK